MNKNHINIIYKALLITCLYFFASYNSFASNSDFHTYKQVVDSSTSFLWNTTDDDWDYCSFYNYKYDSLGNKIEYLRKYYDFNNSKWQNETKNNISNNNYENVYNLILQNWDTLNNVWENSSHDTIYFDDANKEISEKFFQWDTSYNKWANQNYKMSLYSDNKLSSDTIKNWDTVLNKWINNIYYDYTYETNLMNVNSFLWDTTINNWINNEKKLISYNSTGEETRLTAKQWDTTSNDWINNYQYSITYNSENKKIKYRFQINDTATNAWVNCYRDTLIYDEYGNDSIFLSQIWDEETTFWINKSKSINSFDEKRNITKQTSFNWNNDTEIWDNYSKIEYFWSEIECHLTVAITDSTSILCFGNNKGTATITANGGIKPYIYQWDDNLNTTSPTVENLSPNVYYHVVVTDSLQCQATDSIKLSQPDELLINFSNSTNVSCFGVNDGNASINAIGGTKPYIYQWDDNLNSTSPTVANLSANIYYHVVVTDSLQCQATDSIRLSQPDELLINFSNSTNVSCFGVNNGNASINANGGTKPYIYQWDDNLNSTAPTIDNLSANIYYHVVVTDSLQCKATDSIKLSQPDELLINFSNSTNISCFGVNDGNASINVTGGTKPYIYQWDDNLNTTTPTIDNLSANIYYHVVVTDSLQCQATDSMKLSQPNELLINFSNSTNVSCFGFNDGDASINATGGTEPYIYQWEDNLNTTSPTIENLYANIYYPVVVTDSVQCHATDSIKLSQPDELLINFSNSTNVSCFGFNDGNASINATGGTKPYIYQWDDAENSTTSSVSKLEANIFYHISITDNNGCTTVDSIMLSEPDNVITSTISGPINVVKDEIAVYYISKTINSVYIWDVYGGEILNGQGTDSISVNWQIVGTNKISVLETADNGCNGDTVKLNVSVGTNDITDINNNKHIVVYPNPFKNFTTIYLPKDKKYYKIDVIDIQGRIVKSFHEISKNKISLSAEGLNSGFYYIRILSDNIIYTKKIIRK